MLSYLSQNYTHNLKDWYNSDYKSDREQEPSRLVCVDDLFSNLYRLTEEILAFVMPLIKGIAGLALSVALIPATVLTACSSSPQVEGLRLFHVAVLYETADGFSGFISAFVIFKTLPQLFLRIVGNGIGIVFPEVGFYFRSAECLRLSPLKNEQDYDNAQRWVSLWKGFVALYRLAERTVDVVKHLLAGFGSLALVIVMVPVTVVTACSSRECAQTWRKWHVQVLGFVGASFYNVRLREYLFEVIPKSLLTVVCSATSLVFETLAPRIESCQWLKLPARESDD